MYTYTGSIKINYFKYRDVIISEYQVNILNPCPAEYLEVF